MTEQQSKANTTFGHINRSTECTVRKVTYTSPAPILGSVLGPEQNRVWTNQDHPEDVSGTETTSKRSGRRSKVLSLGMSTARTDLVTVPRSLQGSSRTGQPGGAVSPEGGVGTLGSHRGRCQLNM